MIPTTGEGRRHAPSVPSFTHEDNGVTFMIVAGAGVSVWTPERLQMELDLGRRVWVIPTPTASEWLDHTQIERMTGWKMRPALRHPTTPTFSPPGCRVLASPVTLNTLTKWAAGHSDNFAISLLCEAVGLGIETRAEISLSQAYANHPAAGEALERLETMGVDLYRVKGAAHHPLLKQTAPVLHPSDFR